MTKPTVKILLIDDDEDDYVMIRDLLRDLEGEKYDLEWKSNFSSGLARIREQAHDIYLTDYRLGEASGLELLEAATKTPLKAPIIILTGVGDRDVDLQAMRLGAADYLVKGQITAPLLDRAIRYALKHARDLETLRQREAEILHQDRLASIGILASGLAHEIGTPLGVIRGRAEYLSMQVKEEGVRKGLDIIIGQIDRISKLIHSLMHLARRDHTAVRTSVRVAGAVDIVLGLMGHEFKKSGIEVMSQLPHDAVIRAEPEPFEQVILNLLFNALHAVQAAIKTGRASGHFVRLQLQEAGNNWEFSIEDSGCGIPNAILDNIFKPFFTTKEVGVGTGLGLATSDRIVRSWGGSIRVSSTEGVGTTFTVVLPKA